MDLSQFFAEVKRRNIRKLAVAYVTAGLLLIELPRFCWRSLKQRLGE
jgi:hypothetical protein